METLNRRATQSLAANEATHLLRKEQQRPKAPLWRPIYTVLLCGFLVSLSFGVTQTPLIYVLHLMTCEAYYKNHPRSVDDFDRCSIPEIEAGTARAVALLGSSTTLFGIVNLFITGYSIKRHGVRFALLMQVFWPAARPAVQGWGISIGGSLGITIVQSSQIITIIGGPTGYLLALNTYVSELAENDSRTGYLGRLQGCTLFGSAVGFFIGGQLSQFNIELPFHVTSGLFLASTVFVRSLLPWIPPVGTDNASNSNSTVWSRMFGPLQTIYPANWINIDGRVRRQFGPLILALGAFLATLATGYIPTLLQLYATGTFGFNASDNSYLVSSHLFLRGAFLTLIFPRILTIGRKIVEKRSRIRGLASTDVNAAQPSSAAETDAHRSVQGEPGTDSTANGLAGEQVIHSFDLIYTRASLLIDGTITLGASFVQHGWQMFVISAILPFGAGTSSAAKGTILQMCPSKDRTDALAAISLLEMMGRLSTTLVFGLVFGAFASIGKTYLVFVCNAGVALFGFAILLLAQFPPPGSRRADTPTEQSENDSCGLET